MKQTIKIMRLNVRLIFGVLTAAIVIGLLVYFTIPRLRRAQVPAAPPYWPTTNWHSSTPEAQGIDSNRLADLVLAIREHNIQIHSLLLIRNGYVVADATFYPYDGKDVHDVASVTKSVMTTLIGIAADQGKLDLDDTLVSFFPNRSITNLDTRKGQITVRHLVSMSSGLECIRDGRDGETNQEMQASPDFVQFALDRPVRWEPGSHFVYCSPAIHLLSPILEQATGMTALEFARQYLFEPLGIRDAMWEKDPQGYYDGWGDLSLYPRDMAKLGLLFLQKGQWDGRQIVSRKWVEEATQAQMVTAGGEEDPYGYGWWLTPDLEGVYRADGRLGQYIYILPEWNMILVTTGGGFDIEEIGEALLAIFAEMQEQLPANPEGVARLEAAAAAVVQPPEPAPVAPLSEVARLVSGRAYVFDSNPLELQSITFEFDGSPEARATLVAGDQPPVSWNVGLDDVYRFSTGPDGRPLGLRGAWTDAQTFVLEYNGITINDHSLLEFHFVDERVEVKFKEGQVIVVQFEGRLQGL